MFCPRFSNSYHRVSISTISTCIHLLRLPLDEDKSLQSYSCNIVNALNILISKDSFVFRSGSDETNSKEKCFLFFGSLPSTIQVFACFSVMLLLLRKHTQTGTLYKTKESCICTRLLLIFLTHK